LLFLSQAGYRIIFAFRQYQIREEVKQRLLASIPEKMLDVIDADLNKEKIEWEDEGREFYLQGQLYDIAYTKIVNGRVLIYCLNDVKEEKLLATLAKINVNQTNQKSGNPAGDHKVKFHSPDLILFAEPDLLPEQVLQQRYFVHTINLISVTTDVPTPPPDQKSKNQTEIL